MKISIPLGWINLRVNILQSQNIYLNSDWKRHSVKRQETETKTEKTKQNEYTYSSQRQMQSMKTCWGISMRKWNVHITNENEWKENKVFCVFV